MKSEGEESFKLFYIMLLKINFFHVNLDCVIFTHTFNIFYPDSYETSSSSYEMDIKWRNVIIFIYLHATAIYAWTLEKKLSTVVVGWILGILAGIVADHYF